MATIIASRCYPKGSMATIVASRCYPRGTMATIIASRWSKVNFLLVIVWKLLL